jgi:hypothetical protein
MNASSQEYIGVYQPYFHPLPEPYWYLPVLPIKPICLRSLLSRSAAQ